MRDGTYLRRLFLKKLAIGAVAVPAAVAGDAPLLNAETRRQAPSPRSTAGDSSYIFNVQDFGAVGDGKTVCTAAIQSAIDACAKAGGGRVVVPPGRFVTAPLFLRSNLEFEVSAGAVLAGATDLSLYPTIHGRWEGIDRTVFASMLTGEDLENISIIGSGTLDGQGSGWWDAHRKTMAMRAQMGLADREPENPPGAPLRWPRPRTINLYRCRNVRISGLTIQNSPSWTVHPVLCDQVRIESLRILGPGDSPNTDGIDPDSCRNMVISDCYISTGDDCIVIKSGYRYQPGAPYRPSENIAITNCVFGEGHGGVVIGSETAGGVRGIAASNCVCDGTRRGLYFKTARGRGNIVENVRAENFVMRNIKETAVFVSMFYDNADREKAAAVDDFTPTMRHIYCNNITVQGAPRSVVIEGLPERPLESIGLTDVRILSAGDGIRCSGVNGMTFENIISNPDAGPPVEVTGVRDLEMVRVRTEKSYPGPVIVLERIDGGVVQSCSAAAGNSALVELKGTENHAVELALNRPPKDGKEILLSGGAAENAVIRRG